MTESLASTDLAALIGSRICHDLISPIGAIGNGVELLLMDGAGKSPEIALIAESVASANARIRFYRVAFGAATPDQRIGGREIGSILSDLTRGGRLSVEWHGTPDLSRVEAKMAFLALLCLEHALPLGGRITIAESGGRWQVTGRSVRLRLDPGLWTHLSPAFGTVPTPVAPAQVQFALLAAAVQDRAITVDERPDEVVITF